MDRLAVLAALGESPLPYPGGGSTAERHRRLFALGRRNLSVARVLEAHTDALAILHEAGHPSPEPQALFGVWASDGPASRLDALELPSGEWQLSGIKQYCTGATLCTDALVTAHHASGLLLFHVNLMHPRIVPQPSTWTSHAFADTATVPVRFEDLVIPQSGLVGNTPGWYISRTGFWHGAVGPAACWAGGGASLADSAISIGRKDPHFFAHAGALRASVWGLSAYLAKAGEEIDSDPCDHGHAAKSRALSVRHLIERECTRILDRFGRATGPQLLAFDAPAGEQYAALTLYIRQCHAERDLAALGAEKG